MFYCFVYLKGWVNDVWKLLEFKCSDYLFNIYNLIEYYVVFVGLVVDKIDFISKIEYIVFGEYKQLLFFVFGGKNVKWVVINDYGGSFGIEICLL